jgi:protein-tyrosine phosphatase
MRILMVCLGNICRSPLAEGILQEKAWRAGLPWSVESAGTNGYHDGEPPHPLSRKVALLNGIDISRQRSRRFRADDFEQFDRIYAMAGDVMEEIRRIAGRRFDPARADLLLNLLHPGRDLDVPDPWGGPESDYHQVYRLLDDACARLVETHTEKSDTK